MTRSNIDVLVAGGGFAGLTLAIALRQGLGPSFSVTVADPTLGMSRGEDERASAIVAAARRLFETIGVWQAVAADAQPILDMVVTDSRLADAVRPTFLTFAGEVEPGEPFAHMIENRLLVDALAAKAREVGVTLRPSAVATFARDGDRVTAALADGSELSARLLVAADGARSTYSHCRGHCHPRLELRPVRHRHQCRARARPRGTRRGAFSPGRSVCDPAAQRPPLLDRVDRDDRGGGAHRGVARRCVPCRAGAALQAASRRHPGDRRAARAIRSASLSRAPSSPTVSRLSATPRMSSTRSPARASTWD